MFETIAQKFFIIMVLWIHVVLVVWYFHIVFAKGKKNWM